MLQMRAGVVLFNLSWILRGNMFEARIWSKRVATLTLCLILEEESLDMSKSSLYFLQCIEISFVLVSDCCLRLRHHPGQFRRQHRLLHSFMGPRWGKLEVYKLVMSCERWRLNISWPSVIQELAILVTYQEKYRNKRTWIRERRRFRAASNQFYCVMKLHLMRHRTSCASYWIDTLKCSWLFLEHVDYLISGCIRKVDPNARDEIE